MLVSMKPKTSNNLFLVLFLWAFAGFACSNDEPTIEDETKEQKQKEVVESFSGDSISDGGEHAAGIRRFFDDFPKATSNNDYAKVNELFDMRMAFKLLEKRDLLPEKVPDEDQFISIMKAAMAPRMCDPVQGVHYQRYEIRNVRFLREDKKEALVYLRMWDADQIQLKMRWWLHNHDNRWKAYDYEALEMSMRFSTMFGVGAKMAKEKHPAIHQFPKLMEGIQLVAQGDTESALAVFENLENAGFPPVLESLRLLALSACLSDFGEFRRSVSIADKALALNPDMPTLHHIYAVNYNGLGEYEQALEHANKYASQLGKDGDYYGEAGDAFAGLGKKAQALRAYRNGIADDPSSASFCVLGLMKTLPAEERKELRFHYERLANLEDRLIELGEYLFAQEDADTLRVLLEVHRHFRPNDENLEYYVDALGELE